MKKTNELCTDGPYPPQWARRFALLALIVLPGLSVVFEARAATYSWSGGGGVNANWNDSANWGFAGTPTNGDTVIFPGGAANLVNSNNIAGLTLDNIIFAGTSGGYDIRGNAFTLTN